MYKQAITALGFAVISNFTAAQTAEYQVTITNITPGQSFTPQLVVTHDPSVRLFKLGASASEPLEMLAEGGDTGPLIEAVGDAATDAKTIDGLLGPGETATTTIMGDPDSDTISIAAMLIPTNDVFFALNRAGLPKSGGYQRLLDAYDAGTEENDQSCASIPGPRCGGEGYNSDGGEGFVHISNGFHELGDTDSNGAEVLGPQTYDWRNSVARITVKRLN
jgi:hypothetical protein